MGVPGKVRPRATREAESRSAYHSRREGGRGASGSVPARVSRSEMCRRSQKALENWIRSG